MKQLFVVLLCCLTAAAPAQILPLRQQALLQDSLLHYRFQTVLPSLMQQHGIDMWIVTGREYAEDPVLKTMLPATWLHARRRTILVFTLRGDSVERLIVARYDAGKLYKAVWNPDNEPNQWKRLAQVVQERLPKRIGINTSGLFAHADGLTKTESDSLQLYLKGLPVVSAEGLAVDWLQLRTDKELKVYEQMCNLTHKIISEAFSAAVIQPGRTTTDDVVWWLRNKVQSLGLQTWFHPTVDVQRSAAGQGDAQRSFAQRPKEEVIQYGDLLHCDFGISYLGLHTDMQEMAYVLKPGEKKAPPYLQKAFAAGNRLQDILTAQFALNKTGNEVLKATLEQAKQQGLQPSVYSHPIGFHGHAAGPAIGMWDAQNGVPGTGDVLLKYNTAYAIELNVTVPVQEWNKDVRIMLEQQGLFSATGVRYAGGRQTALLLVGKEK